MAPAREGSGNRTTFSGVGISPMRPSLTAMSGSMRGSRSCRLGLRGNFSGRGLREVVQRRRRAGIGDTAMRLIIACAITSILEIFLNTK